jgi:hypothetical protein
MLRPVVEEKDGDVVLLGGKWRRQTHLNNPVHTNTSLSKYALNVLTAHLGLVRDAPLNQVTLCVGGNLAGDEDVGARDYGLAL